MGQGQKGVKLTYTWNQCVKASADGWKQQLTGFPHLSTNKQFHVKWWAGWLRLPRLYLVSVQPFSEFGEGGQSSESESDSPSAMYGRMAAQGVAAAPPLCCSPRLVEE